MSFDQIIKTLSQSSSFLISTHKNCDGDGLGGGLALSYGLKQLNKKSSFYSLEKPHKKYSFLNSQNDIQIFDKNNFPYDKNTDLLIVDTNDPLCIEPLYSLAKERGMRVHFLDHHPLIKKNEEDIFLIDSQASSTAEIIYAVLKKLGVSIDEKIATALFTSVVFDTNQFRNIKNSPSPFAIASEMIPHIKDVNVIYDSLFKNLTIDNLKFFTQVDRVEYHLNNTVAFLYLNQKDLKKTNSDINQAMDLMDIIRDISSIKYTILIVENPDQSLKLSLRSRDKDLIPIAQVFQGGGHQHSAGADITGHKVQDVKDKIISYFKS